MKDAGKKVCIQDRENFMFNQKNYPNCRKNMQNIPSQNLPIYLVDFKTSSKNVHFLKYVNVSLNPTNKDSKRVWNFVLSGFVKANTLEYEIELDFSDIPDDYSATLSRYPQGVFQQNNNYFSMKNVTLSKNYEKRTITIIVKNPCISKKRNHIFYLNFDLFDCSGSCSTVCSGCYDTSGPCCLTGDCVTGDDCISICNRCNDCCCLNGNLGSC